jgi:O-antigen/teichoic acid export membrane protein
MLAGRVLGAEWREIGYIVTALALGSYAQFCTAPFAQILNLTGHSRMLMYWDLGRAAAALISLSAAGILGLTLPVAIFAFSASMFAVYACLAILVSSALTARQTSIEVLK